MHDSRPASRALRAAVLLAALLSLRATNAFAADPRVLFPPDFYLTPDMEVKVLAFDPSGKDKLDASVNFRKVPGAGRYRR